MAGLVLARRPSNRLRNRWAVDLLELEPTHRVLELGYGPGLAIQLCARRVSLGRVVGVDHSETMLRVATRRNARAVREGRVSLHVAPFEQLPDLGPPFDRIMAVNALHFVDDEPALLESLSHMLAPGGVLAVTHQPRGANATSADAVSLGRQRAVVLERAGLEAVRVESLDLEPVAAVATLGRRPIGRG
jgi:ubiquinone/menaquinone biosynthesis C-methylase UbiE